MKSIWKNTAAIALLFVLTVSAAAGCGSAGSDVSGQAADLALTVAETAADFYEYAAEPEENGISYDSGVAASFVRTDGQAAGGGSPAGAAAAQPETGNRKLIRTVTLNVETTGFDGLLEAITQNVNESGGYIEQSDISGNSISYSGGSRYAFITVRIPADSMDSFLSRVDEQSNVTYRSESVQDVTLTYTDIESRKKSLTIEQERLWDLLEKADSLDSVIALEERLSEIRYELESLESSLRSYDNQADYSTVYLNISEVAVFTPTQPDSVLTRIQKGFSRNLSALTDGFINGFVWFISSLPTLILIGIAAAAVILIIRLLVRRRSRKARTAFPENKESGSSSPENPEP